METRRLKDPGTFPDNEVLKQALGAAYRAFEALIGTVTGTDFGLNAEWRYYRDGGSWLCKVTHKKKTIFWLSVWDAYFRTTFYFTEKTRHGISALDIHNTLKAEFERRRYTGKLVPFTISVRTEEQIKDILKLVAYKKSLK